MSSKITKISAKPREDREREDQTRANRVRESENHENHAHEAGLRAESAKNTESTNVATAEKPAKISKTDKKLNKKAKKSQKISQQGDEKPLKSVFILARPFVAFGRYLRDSWRELRMVRWPSRGATWKMTLAVLVYCAIFIIFIVLLDLFFTFIFNLIFGTN